MTSWNFNSYVCIGVFHIGTYILKIRYLLILPDAWYYNKSTVSTILTKEGAKKIQSMATFGSQIGS